MKHRYNSGTPIKYFFKPDYGTCKRTCFHKIIGLKNSENGLSYKLDPNSKIFVELLTKKTDGTLQGELIEGTIDSNAFYYPSYKKNAAPVKITKNNKNISIKKVDKEQVDEHLKNEYTKMFIF